MTTRATPPQKGAHDMTTEAAPEAGVAHFTIDPDDQIESLEDREVFQFTLGRPEEDPTKSKVLTARRPKASIMMKLSQVNPNTKDPAVISGVLDTFLRNVLDTESREYVEGRLYDPDDDWDIDMLIPIVNACKSRWYGGRPTGRATGSSGSPSSRGRRSTGRARSRG